MRSFLTTTAALAALAFAAPASADHHGDAGSVMTVDATQFAPVLADARRSEDVPRDAWRHPAETLAFFRVEPGMTVADYMPSSGWYTRILVPYLGTEGRYVGLTPDPASTADERFSTYFAGLPKDYTDKVGDWNLTGALQVIAASNDDGLASYAGDVDRVLIFREMHNLLRSGALRPELMRIREMLKDDGMLGVVQHRAKPTADGDYTDGNKGYLRQSDVIGLIEAHGFELVETSEINANPRDPANWEDGVWMLPPGNRGDDPKAAAVGESDRMTLLFRKR